jgi:hypothetical protein
MVLVYCPQTYFKCDLETTASASIFGEGLEAKPSLQSSIFSVWQKKAIHSQQGGTCNGR